MIHLVKKPYEEIYPDWPGDVHDSQIDRMIREILAGELDETFWDVKDRPAAAPQGKKRKVEAVQLEREISKKVVTKATEPEKRKKAPEVVKSTKCPKEKEPLDLPPHQTFAEFQKVVKEKKIGNDIKAMKEWRKQYEARAQSDERDKK